MPAATKRAFKWVQPVVLPLFAAVGCGIIASTIIMSRKLLHVCTRPSVIVMLVVACQAIRMSSGNVTAVKIHRVLLTQRQS